jgi:hypothetical protein
MYVRTVSLAGDGNGDKDGYGDGKKGGGRA